MALGGSAVEVYFDDFKVEHVKSPVVQVEDYYPFGLTFNSYQRENGIPNQYKFNGIEERDELGINTYQAFFRTMDPAIGRWWQVDPKVDNYYSVTPYSAMDNNPIRNADPLGDEWADPKKDSEMASSISSGLSKINKSLANKNTKLDGQIKKAKEKNNTDRVAKLNARKEDNTQRINANNKTIDHLGKMATDTKLKFTFETVAGGRGDTFVSQEGVITMKVTDGIGSKVHEVSHGSDYLFPRPQGEAAGREAGEIRAYQAQYGADPTSLPVSKFSGQPASFNEITGSYIGGIIQPMTDPKTSAPIELLVYPSIYEKYHHGRVWPEMRKGLEY